MTRPKLYPGHMHEWTRVGQTSPDLVRCTVCGFEAPRNVAGLDGRLATKIPTLTDVRRFINDHPDLSTWTADALEQPDPDQESRPA